MFPTSYFPVSYFAPTWFPPGGVFVAVVSKLKGLMINMGRMGMR